MGTRSAIRWEILGYLFAIAFILFGLAAQFSGWVSMIALWVFTALGVVCFLIFLVLITKWFVLNRRERLLLTGQVYPDRSVETKTREYTWRLTVTVLNNSDELPIGTTKISLRVRRGDRMTDLEPLESQTIYLKPKESHDLALTFKGIKVLEVENETEPYEHCTLKISDSWGFAYEVPAGIFPTHV